MCTHARLITNKYTHKSVLVNCGKCPACRQAKAVARANRIRNHSVAGEIALFVTLTYSNEFLPYIRRSDLDSGSNFIPIYRGATVRSYRGKKIIDFEPCQIDEYWIGDTPTFHQDIPSPTNLESDKISVIYYKDLQDFLKRLRINLSRHYDYNKTISYFACAEYGSHRKRAHFHLLLFCSTDAYETLQSAIVESWSMCDKARTKNYIEIAKNAASYVASYVNCSNSFPSFLQNSPFHQTHSYSKNFGVRLECFSLAKVLEKVRGGDMSYNVSRTINGIPCVATVPFPKYVINRYFPKFKGYSVLSDNEIQQFLFRIDELTELIYKRNPLLKYNDEEKHGLFIRIINIRKLFQKELGWSLQQFQRLYPKLLTGAWSGYYSTLHRISYSSINHVVDWLDYYENIAEVECRNIKTDFISYIDSFGWFDKLQRDPNSRKDILQRTSHLTDIFHKMDKNKRVVNFAMSESGHYV